MLHRLVPPEERQQHSTAQQITSPKTYQDTALWRVIAAVLSDLIHSKQYARQHCLSVIGVIKGKKLVVKCEGAVEEPTGGSPLLGGSPFLLSSLAGLFNQCTIFVGVSATRDFNFVVHALPPEGCSSCRGGAANVVSADAHWGIAIWASCPGPCAPKPESAHAHIAHRFNRNE